VVVTLLYVLAVIPFAVGEPEQPFFQDGVAPVPERHRKAQPLLVIADAEQAVFAPPVGAAARRVVSERLPGAAVGTVVLANRAPLPFAEIRSPDLPAVVGRLLQP